MRWLTALVIICICVPTVVWGWQAMLFAREREAILEPAAKAASGAWSGVPGLTGEALETSLRQPAVTELPPAREAQLVELIAAHPMSAQAWLSLAGERLALGRSASQTDAAVLMSRVTGPNEGTIMWRRGLFELVRWPVLSPDARQRAAADLAGALSGGAVDDQGFSLIKSILAQHSAGARAAIAAALSLAGFSQTQLATIGLEAGQS